MSIGVDNRVSGVSLLRRLMVRPAPDVVSDQKIATDLWAVEPIAARPTGFMRSYFGMLTTELANYQRAKSKLQTIQGGVDRINNLLLEMRAQVFELLMNPTNDREWLNTLQGRIAENVDRISRIVQEAKFDEIALLDGTQSFKLRELPATIVEANITRAMIPIVSDASGKRASELEVVIQVTAPASKARVEGTIPAIQTQPATIRIQGLLGGAILNLKDGMTRSEIETVINALAESTGVEARGGVIQSVVYGPSAFVNVEFISGRIEGVQPGVYTGSALEATVGGVKAVPVTNTQALATSMMGIMVPSTRAVVFGTIATTQSAASRIRIRGARGEVTIDIPAGASRSQVENLISSQWQNTGVVASGGTIKSMEPGKAQFIEIEFEQGVLESIVPGSYYRGTDREIGIDGETASVEAHAVTFESEAVAGWVVFAPGTEQGEYRFKIEGGLTIEMRENGERTEELRFGIPDLSPSALGMKRGYGSVQSILSQVNAMSVNPRGALRVLDEALMDVRRLTETVAVMEKEIEKREFKALKLVNGELARRRVEPLDELDPEVLARLARRYILQSPLVSAYGIVGGIDALVVEYLLT